MSPPPHPPETPEDADPANALAPARARPGEAKARSTTKGDVPPALLDRYLVERDRQGRAERFFRDHRTPEPAFRDTGRTLTTTRAYPDTIADMLKVAQHRGWTRLTVRGDDAFRRDVWIQAQSLGLEVAGYRPRERDRQAAGERSPEPALRRDSRPDLQARLRMASTVVRALVADPEMQARLIAHAQQRAEALLQRRNDSPVRRPADRSRDHRDRS